MDEYTTKTKAWLNKRYRYADAQGIYFAHQPIYGFRKGHSEANPFLRYTITYQILKALSHLKFDSFLDVGAAEGYKAHVVQSLFGAKVSSSDLSEEACNRAREIFGIESRPADVHDLPYKNDEFDVALCSETLEHVTDLKKATGELLRVSRNAVIVTVPHEPEELVAHNIQEQTPHGHINQFDATSFDWLKSSGYDIHVAKLKSWLLRVPAILIEAEPRAFSGKMKYSKPFIDLYNGLRPIFRGLCGERTMAMLVRLDDMLSRSTSTYESLLITIVKNRAAYSQTPTRGVSVRELMNVTTPFHILKGERELFDPKAENGH